MSGSVRLHIVLLLDPRPQRDPLIEPHDLHRNGWKAITAFLQTL
jgi:hypothetical protein